MLFTYKSTDKKGKIKKGEIQALNINEARNKLLLRQDAVISLEPISKKKKKGKSTIVFGRIKSIEKVMLAKHLSVMIKAGMAIDHALEVLADNSSPLMSKKLKEVLQDIKQGNSLSSALKKYPKDFDILFINMISVGEAGGTLAKNLNLLSIQQRKSYDLKNKIKAASMYPALILLAIIGLIIVVSIFVLPKIINFFTTLNVELPLSTKILIGSAKFLTGNWLLLLIIFLIIIIGIQLMKRFDNTRLLLHLFILKIPFVNKLVGNINIALFCRTLSSLLDSGISIDKALQITSQTVTNDSYKKEISIVYHNILKGNSLADSLSNREYFPSLVSQMSKVGERSGNLSENLDYLADFYETEVDTITKNLSTILEPALLIFIGLVVGFVAMSIINPIYELTSRVGG